jgi:hypothetical protein
MEDSIIYMDLDVVKYLNNKTCDEIIKLLNSENLLGKGFWGSVYKFDIKGHKISVKIQPLENDKTYDVTIKDPRNISLEVSLLKKLSQYKILNNFIHFPYFYSSMECSGQNLMFYEYYSHNLKHFFLTEYNFNDFKNITYQILISIFYFQKVTGYYHNDIHVENFLINKLSNPIEQNYVFNTKKTFILEKYIVSIWDFANAIKINSNDKINLDLIKFKSMFEKFSKNRIENLLDYHELYEFCINTNNNFDKYYQKELKENKIKWKHISNKNRRSDKIEKSVKKSIIYWIIQNKYLDQLVNYFKLHNLSSPLYFPTDEMLDWIQTIPDNFDKIWINF